MLAAVDLDVATAYGLGTSSPGGSGITVEPGLAMMVLAAVWSLFREEVLRYQLRLGTALYDLPRPAEPAQVPNLPRSRPPNTSAPSFAFCCSFRVSSSGRPG